jgi:hypothetical protein
MYNTITPAFFSAKQSRPPFRASLTFNRTLSWRIGYLYLAYLLLLPLLLTVPAQLTTTSNPTITTTTSLRSSLETKFSNSPELTEALANRSSFGLVNRTIAGQPIQGYSPATQPLAPDGLKSQEQQAWVAFAQKSVNLGATQAGLSFVFPQHYQERFVVEGTQGQLVELWALGGNAVAANPEDGTLVYREAYLQTDSLNLVSAGSSKEFLYLHSATAPTRFQY